ncbi:uncharacterized protein PV07_03902 [Cladophialophora immunda]|uniref:Heterokaryon incompatibility domain-containing protein n=1 Tax=Cladophialophora immunda TaxID=569365 RepID=A0A0D2D9E9_9EURO|nr:uncharacterized protein PV07_03902 [Cladophialophora immunda]KIW32349.1 hypothetical protein PV07_03902 [Cladophialophora immunda]
MMLCQYCEKPISAAVKALKGTGYEEKIELPLQRSRSSILQSAEEGCFICSRLDLDSERNIEDDFSCEDDESESEIDNSLELTIKTRKESEGYFILNISPSGGRALDLVLAPIPANSADTDTSIKSKSITRAAFSTPRTLELCCGWFRACSESHTKCRELARKPQTFTPHRLVEIFAEGDGKSFSWRIVHPTDTESATYVTLSHCWGKSQRTCLTRSNRCTFAEWVSFSDLPKTYQDAFLIAFSLGVRFIWIDSLCIVQDDDEDWTAQASMMGQVYQGACCNIAATWAKNGDGGCFIQTRTPTLITLDLEPSQPTPYEVFLWTFYYEELVEAPLNQRGWVVQERYLARKQLSFTESGAYWECHELVASERFPTGIPSDLTDFSPYDRSRPPTGKPTLDLSRPSAVREAWAVLVESYSACRLTFVSDKMVALAGLAEAVKEATGDLYLAGMWKNDLESQVSHGRNEAVDWMFQLTNLDESTRQCMVEGVPVEIMWDENLPYRGANPERWASFIKERESNFLCMLVSLQDGLILRRLSDATDDDTYVRMGKFFDWNHKFFDVMCARFNIPPEELLDEGIDLSDVRLTDAVHRVTVV